ncbi:MAG: thermonuclease family protein [Oscillospiraceae bacterium]|nr:thermonuclease family protein [Oscillospiraceae bacterium]
MNRFRKLLVFLILACLSLTACGSEPAPTVPQTTAATAPAETVDYAASLKLDMSTDTAKQEVTVKSFIDGDTVHFHVPEAVMADGVLKARFLAINTPESTGKIEEYGKAAAAFTKAKLSEAVSILIESETTGWDPDSTGTRYLAWVWYKTAEDADYRNLNIEILQNGLAIANSAANNRYGETCVAAINQAKAQKLNLYSGQPDPDFYYGEAIELTLKELRTNIESYSGMKVAFSGVITANSGTQGVYVEDYDAETGLYYGMYIYYGHGLTGAGLDVLTVGNEARIVGTVQYYEGGGTWQVSDLNYRLMQPDDPGNIQKLSEGNSPAYVLTDADTFVNGQVTLETEEGEFTASYAALVMGTSVEMKGLRVVDVYTTENAGSSSDGAMTFTCDCGGIPVTVRTALLLDENGQRITAETYLGQTIDVKGIVDLYDGTYQIKVFTAENITIN